MIPVGKNVFEIFGCEGNQNSNPSMSGTDIPTAIILILLTNFFSKINDAGIRSGRVIVLYATPAPRDKIEKIRFFLAKYTENITHKDKIISICPMA